MDIVVHGATGAQGSPVVSALTAAGHRVAGVARHPRDLPPGARAAAVDLADTSALTELYSRADGVFCHLPMAAPEQVGAYARSMGRALAAARPPRIVVSTSGQPVPEAGGEGASPLAILLGILKNSGLHVAVIATRLYLENLLLPPVLSAVRGQGVLRYPLAEDFEASWCSHLDVADAACALLTGTPSPTGVVEVGHLPGLRGCDLAAGLADGLGALRCATRPLLRRTSAPPSHRWSAVRPLRPSSPSMRGSPLRTAGLSRPGAVRSSYWTCARAGSPPGCARSCPRGPVSRSARQRRTAVTQRYEPDEWGRGTEPWTHITLMPF